MQLKRIDKNSSSNPLFFCMHAPTPRIYKGFIRILNIALEKVTRYFELTIIILRSDSDKRNLKHEITHFFEIKLKERGVKVPYGSLARKLGY